MLLLIFVIFIGIGIVVSILLKIIEKEEMEEYSLDSPIELRLLKAFKREGINVIPQYKVKGYRIDMAYFPEGEDSEVKIAIECDSRKYHTLPKDKEWDREKNKFLRKEGWRVIRFTGHQVYKNPYKLVNKVIGIAEAQGRIKKFRSKQEKRCAIFKPTDNTEAIASVR